MQLIQLRTGLIKANTYIIHNGKDAAIIDPGGNEKRILTTLQEHNLNLVQILLTHGHFDHIGAVAALKAATGAKIYIHTADAAMLNNDELNLSVTFRTSVRPSYADVLLIDKDTIETPAGTVLVLHTPGHTKGGVCYLIENVIFTGDTLFAGSIGRTDFPGGSYEELITSIKNQLFVLDKDYTLYPGHEESTTLLTEKRTNPFLEFGYDK